MKFIKGLFAGLGIGLAVAVGLYVLAQIVDLVGCFFTCGSMKCFTQNSCAGRLGMYRGTVALAIFGFCGIAGTVVGTIYGIVKQVQADAWENERKRNAKKAERVKNEKDIDKANISVQSVKDKSDNIVSLIKNAENTIVSTRAKKLLEEAATAANQSDLALERAAKDAVKAKGKTSKRAKKIAQQSEDSSVWSVEDVNAAIDLYDQAVKEEADWNRLQQEVNDAVSKAKGSADNAEKEMAKIQNTVFTAAAAKDAVEKAACAAAKAKEAADEAAKTGEAAGKADSAQEAGLDAAQVKNSEKRAKIEEKITIEEIKIAMEAEEKQK